MGFVCIWVLKKKITMKTFSIKREILEKGAIISTEEINCSAIIEQDAIEEFNRLVDDAETQKENNLLIKFTLIRQANQTVVTDRCI